MCFPPEMVRLAKQAGCVFVRHGRGDHDTWHSRRNATSFPVDHKIQSRRTAERVLKQAGLP
jgi:hypothetical protein